MQKSKGGEELMAQQGSIKPLAVISAYSGILITFLTVCSQCLLCDSRRRELHLEQLSRSVLQWVSLQFWASEQAHTPKYVSEP